VKLDIFINNEKVEALTWVVHYDKAYYLGREAVENLTAKLKEAKAMVFVDYKGISVNEDTELRKTAREAGVEYFVAKNRLMKIALKSVGVETNFDDLLEGTTSFAVGYEDGIAPSKLIFYFWKKIKDFI